MFLPCRITSNLHVCLGPAMIVGFVAHGLWFKISSRSVVPKKCTHLHLDHLCTLVSHRAQSASRKPSPHKGTLSCKLAISTKHRTANLRSRKQTRETAYELGIASRATKVAWFRHSDQPPTGTSTSDRSVSRGAQLSVFYLGRAVLWAAEGGEKQNCSTSQKQILMETHIT